MPDNIEIHVSLICVKGPKEIIGNGRAHNFAKNNPCLKTQINTVKLKPVNF